MCYGSVRVRHLFVWLKRCWTHFYMAEYICKLPDHIKTSNFLSSHSDLYQISAASAICIKKGILPSWLIVSLFLSIKGFWNRSLYFFTIKWMFSTFFAFVSFISTHYFLEIIEKIFPVPWKKNNSVTNLVLILMSSKDSHLLPVWKLVWYFICWVINLWWVANLHFFNVHVVFWCS